jgi:methylmalonyl-CoA epimerase
MLLTEIDHIAIAVKDLEAAIAYYQNAFGATVDHREVVESDGVEEALLKVAESYIQLLTPTRPDSPVAKAIEKRGEGLHHIGYRVNNCAEALAAMIAAGATAIDKAPRPGSRGTTVASKGQFRNIDRIGAGVTHQFVCVSDCHNHWFHHRHTSSTSRATNY